MGVPQWGPEEEPVMGVWVQGPQKLKNRSSFNANYRVKFNDNSKIDQQSLSNNKCCKLWTQVPRCLSNRKWSWQTLSTKAYTHTVVKIGVYLKVHNVTRNTARNMWKCWRLIDSKFKTSERNWFQNPTDLLPLYACPREQFHIWVVWQLSKIVYIR